MDASNTNYSKQLQVNLERLKLVIIERISTDLLDSTVDFSLHERFLYDDVCMRIKGFVWAEEKSAQYQKIQYPYNWWEAFKERWFTKQMLKMWPVKYKIIVIDVKTIYPTLKAKIPKHERVLSIRRFDYDSQGN